MSLGKALVWPFELRIRFFFVDMGTGEERVRYMERVTWKLTLPCVKQTPIEKLMYGSGNSNKGCINLEGWDGVGDGR